MFQRKSPLIHSYHRSPKLYVVRVQHKWCPDTRQGCADQTLWYMNSKEAGISEPESLKEQWAQNLKLLQKLLPTEIKTISCPVVSHIHSFLTLTFPSLLSVFCSLCQTLDIKYLGERDLSLLQYIGWKALFTMMMLLNTLQKSECCSVASGLPSSLGPWAVLALTQD